MPLCAGLPLMPPPARPAVRGRGAKPLPVPNKWAISPVPELTVSLAPARAAALPTA